MEEVWSLLFIILSVLFSFFFSQKGHLSFKLCLLCMDNPCRVDAGFMKYSNT